MLYENFIIIVSSPSGAGKSTLCNMLIERDEDIKLSVSATTRQKRPGEKEGIHYYFLRKKEFEEKVKNNEFLEHAEVFKNFYGTLREPVEKILGSGKDVLFDIDWQGARQVSEKVEKRKLLKIFILPPSIEILEERLRKRGQDSDEVIRGRMEKAKSEMSHSNEYEHVIINDDLQTAFKELYSIINQKRQENVI